MRQDVEMTFGEHLEELRRRVIYALLGLLVATVLCGIKYDFLLAAMLRPYKLAYDEMTADQRQDDAAQETKTSADSPAPEGETEPSLPDTAVASAVRKIQERLAAVEKRLDAIAPQPKAAPGAAQDAKTSAQRFPRPRVIQGGPLTGYITVILLCVICGIILGSPWILYQMWAFVGVGLHAHERKFVYLYGPFSFFLFIGGAATFYFVMLKYGLRALMSPTLGVMVDGEPLIDPSFFLNDYFKFVALMTLIFGVVFQTPLIVMFLARTEIVPLSALVKQQKIVLMVLLVLSAVLTPQDPVTMIMMAVPLICLYQLGLLLSWISIRYRRRRKTSDEGEEPWDDYERENEGPWQGPDTREKEPSKQPEPDQTQATADAEQPEDQAEDHEDPYAEFQGDDEARGYDDDYSSEQQPHGEPETGEQEPSADVTDEPGAEGEPPPREDEPSDHEPSDGDRAGEPHDAFDAMPGDDDLPPEDRMK